MEEPIGDRLELYLWQSQLLSLIENTDKKLIIVSDHGGSGKSFFAKWMCIYDSKCDYIRSSYNIYQTFEMIKHNASVSVIELMIISEPGQDIDKLFKMMDDNFDKLMIKTKRYIVFTNRLSYIPKNFNDVSHYRIDGRHGPLLSIR